MRRIYCAGIITFCILSLCNGQERKINSKQNVSSQTVINTDAITKKLDVKEFDKHQVNGEWTYIDMNGNSIHVTKDKNEYWEEITDKNTVFTKRKNYYLNGNIKLDAQYFHDSGFAKGIWIYYNQTGKMIKIEDKDAPFIKYPWKQVLIYLKKNQVNVFNKLTRVTNENDRRDVFWQLSWKTGKTDAQGFDIIRNIRIDVNSGQAKILKETYCCKD